MQIQLNGESTQLPERCTIAQLLEIAGLAQRRVAVEVNREVIPRSRHDQHRLDEGDRVEVVHALGGG